MAESADNITPLDEDELQRNYCVRVLQTCPVKLLEGKAKRSFESILKIIKRQPHRDDDINKFSIPFLRERTGDETRETKKKQNNNKHIDMMK